MIAKVRMFAVAKQLVGGDLVELELKDPSTVACLRKALAAKCPALSSLMPHLLIALDSRYADDAEKVISGMEIACIPPVSGG